MRITFVLIVAVVCVVTPGPVASAQSGCVLEVEAVDTTGGPSPAGILVEVTPAGGTGTVGVLPGGGAAAVFDGLPCGPGVATAAQLQGLPGIATVRAWGRADYHLVAGGPGRVRIQVPVLHRVAVRVEDEEGRSVAAGVISVENVSSTEGPVVAGGLFPFTADGRTAFFLESGRFRIAFRPQRGREVVEVLVNGSPVETEPVVDVSAPLEVMFRVTAAIRITGAVTDTNGRPVRGVFLETRDDTGMRCVRCWVPRSDGSFAIDATRLPVTVHPGHDESWTFEPPRIEVRAREETEGLLFIARPDETMQLAGVVLKSRDGDPVPEATVLSTPGCAEGTETRREWRASVSTDDDGRFEVPCPQECTLDITVMPPSDSGFLVARWTGSSDDCAHVQSIVLQRGNTVEGTVRDSRNRPVAGLALTVRNRPAESVTDDEGRYALTGIGRGVIEIAIATPTASGERGGWVLVPADAPSDLAYAEPPTVRFEDHGDETVELDLRLVEGGHLCLTVTEPDGEPAPVERLRVYAPGHDIPRARRDAAQAIQREEPGRLCIGPVPPGYYQTLAGERRGRFVPTWWPGQEDRELATMVEVEEAGTVEIGPMSVRPAGSAVLRPEGVAFEKDTSVEVRIRRVEVEKEEETTAAEDPAANESESGTDNDSEESSWEPVPESWISLVNRTPIRDRDEERVYDEVGVAPLPIGRWEIWLCAGPKGCGGEHMWCSEKPLNVKRGERTEAMLLPVGEEGCASAPETETEHPSSAASGES